MILPLVFAVADALSDMRATLTQMPATSAVHGSFDVNSTSSDSDSNQTYAGKASVAFEADEGGLRVIYPKTTLDQATQETRAEAMDPDRQTPVRSGMSRVHALHLADLLDAASMLSTELLSAQLVSSNASTFRGKPARLLAFKLSPKVSKGQAKHLKKLDASLSIWLADDGVPLAAEKKLAATASFMLMSFTQEENEKWEFVRAADRLVATRYEETQKAQGLGQHGSSQVVEVVRLEP